MGRGRGERKAVAKHGPVETGELSGFVRGHLRGALAGALGATQDPDAVEFLLDQLVDEETEEYDWIAEQALESLQRLGPVAIEPLAAALASDSPERRAKAALGLGYAGAGSSRAGALLIEALKDPASAVRSAAAGALGRLKEPRAVGRLGELLHNEPEENARECVALALGDLGHEGAEPLVEALEREPSENVQTSIAWALGQTGDLRVTGPLLALLGRDRNAGGLGRPMMVEALGRLRSPQAVDWLLRALEGENDQVRKAAARALGTQGDPRAVPALRRLLRDPDVFGGDAAALALKELGDEQAYRTRFR